MPKYKILSGSHTINKINYRAGTPNNILELTTEQAKPLGDRLALIDDVNGGSANMHNKTVQETIQETTHEVKEESNITVIDKDSAKLLDSNDINLITQHISTVNDLTLLETLYNHEESNKNRQNVLDAINKQYESLGSQENKDMTNADVVTTAKKGKK